MITRLVKMNFRSDQVDTFKRLFDEIKNQIRNFEGCQHLDLLQDTSHQNIIFTLSRWTNQSALDKYKDSGLFIKTWSKTKTLFKDRPEAWSTQLWDAQPMKKEE